MTTTTQKNVKSAIDWHEYHYGFAAHAATKSKDSTRVGAAAFGEANNLLETGYNGLPRGVDDLPDRMERPQKYVWTGHAEENLVAHAARQRLAGSTVYVTHFCCSRCCRLLINSGVNRVVVGPGQTSMPDEEFDAAAVMFAEAGVEVLKMSGVGGFDK